MSFFELKEDEMNGNAEKKGRRRKTKDDDNNEEETLKTVYFRKCFFFSSFFAINKCKASKKKTEESFSYFFFCFFENLKIKEEKEVVKIRGKDDYEELVERRREKLLLFEKPVIFGFFKFLNLSFKIFHLYTLRKKEAKNKMQFFSINFF